MKELSLSSAIFSFFLNFFFHPLFFIRYCQNHNLYYCSYTSQTYNKLYQSYGKNIKPINSFVPDSSVCWTIFILLVSRHLMSGNSMIAAYNDPSSLLRKLHYANEIYSVPPTKTSPLRLSWCFSLSGGPGPVLNAAGPWAHAGVLGCRAPLGPPPPLDIEAKYFRLVL